MKRSIVLVLLVFFSCDFSQGNDRFIRKTLDDGVIEISWYYHSYISDVSPDFVEVKKGDVVKVLFEAKDVISNVQLFGDTIYLSLYKPVRGIVHTKNPDLSFFGYHLLIDSLATREEYYARPDGKKK
ncbi:hypothetical protein BXY85_0489 [Roseivirga pacifica]|uniref:Uncharacterized protein n=1 Tax=Roseivirga pacifica TaxID=1267423 RepID=A0A1I0RSZ2_9BACT|nr:hypothetical protein [Roseivirga pacifica]MCO6357565.1 hypothetical protein [Roseivirga pacifica]MCO6365818.1 hypothetical protein [Roseivirga pacifica]MCO6371147.1 hypothetical protein [Roseivirga pacifica]MCO6375682.1 hypothetical protein [Roseivirga pacifica]MCO6378525.1 hypothetical protein [Roseivirga pacifica]